VIIEDLDEPTEPRAQTRSPLRWQTVRGRLSAVIAGMLIGMVAVAATPPVGRDQPLHAACRPTTTRDASGVITIDGKVGIVGETFTYSGDGSFLILRRGAVLGELASLQFTQIGAIAPATWVLYSSSADPQTSRTRWGDQVAFAAGWKPIAFAGSCWRLIVDGTDTGIVLEVGAGAATWIIETVAWAQATSRKSAPA
jgi:hypothetical protein